MKARTIVKPEVPMSQYSEYFETASTNESNSGNFALSDKVNLGTCSICWDEMVHKDKKN